MPRHIESNDLPEDIARLVEAQVAAGRFASVEDVVRAGVEAVSRVEQKRAAVRAALEEGERSELFEGDAFASVRAEHRCPDFPPYFLIVDGDRGLRRECDQPDVVRRATSLRSIVSAVALFRFSSNRARHWADMGREA